MPNNIEIRSEEVQEIIGHIPNRIIRMGISVIFGIIIFLLIGSFFFKYPDIITTKLQLTGVFPPAEINARVSGKITKLFIADKQKVKENEILAEIENTCSFDDFVYLKNQIDSITKFTSNFNELIINYRPKQHLNLGELQSYYSKFASQITEFSDFVKLDYHNNKIAGINKQITTYRKYILNLKKQLSIVKSDLQLTRKQFKRDSLLFCDKVISEVEYEKSKSSYLLKKSSLINSKNTISNTEITISNLKQNILDLQLQKIEKTQIQKIQILATIELLRSQILKWEQNYIIKSPINGTISFTNFRNINQNVKAGETVFTVLPEKTSKLIAYAKISLSGAGKIKSGQQVNIRFDDFPEVHFGKVKGKIESVSLVSSNKFYIAKISFPDSLTTNYGKTLPFKQNMTGTGDIITEELPLIVRLISPLKTLFYDNF